jgi:uncharacterized protein
MSSNKKANPLINESSPYLLQHAYNPVQWHAWNEESLALAQKEDKPIIVSIGYSACHWCHVMERESFENEELAAIMNEHFICIKVDREERPDVDQIYMDSVQLMGIGGGWPLNVFLSPQQKPFYGGTYFPPQSWKQILLNVANAFNEHRDQLDESAEKFAQALSTSDLLKYNIEGTNAAFAMDNLHDAYSKLAAKFDKTKGGMNKAPKFPMPAIWSFLLRYHHFSQKEEALAHLDLTLESMAKGGIYDQIGGGFSRYSVDTNWLVPHFEKMLYDNGQLISLYSEAYTVLEKPVFKKVVYQSIAFLERELMNEDGGFYAALDADSEGEEGKFYVWHQSELSEIFQETFSPEQAKLLLEFYNITERGNWENGKNILHNHLTADDFARSKGIAKDDFIELQVEAEKILLIERSTRIRPGLDDKILTGWNGIALKGLVDAYLAFGEPKFLKLALKNGAFIHEQLQNGQQLFRSYKNGKAYLQGYLEDYAWVINGYLALYQACFDEKWLKEAGQLTNYVLANFWDFDEELFYYTNAEAKQLIARKKELFDNVIPASNSVMADNLYRLGLLTDREELTEKAGKMMQRTAKLLATDLQYMSNWACLYTMLANPTAEVAIAGKEISHFRLELEKRFFPNKVVAGASAPSTLPLLRDRHIKKGTRIYVCYNKACQLPVSTPAEAWQQMDS